MYKILALAASVEAYTLDLHYHITDGTVTGAAEILDNCPNGDAMAPLGNTFYDYYFNTGGWVDEEPCSCLSWAAGETSEVTYSFDQEYFVWDVLLTASNRASYASLDGAEIHVTRGDMYSTLCATTSATLQGDGAQYDCGGGLPLYGDGLTISSVAPIEFCGLTITGSLSPDAYYSEIVAGIEEAEGMYEELSAKYDSMNRDYFKKYNDYTDLRAKYDLLEDDYDAIVSYKDAVLASTDLLGERQLNLDAQLLAIQGAYDLAVAEKAELDADVAQKDTNIEAYAEVSTMAEKCMIGPIAGWFWYCREGDALVREEDAEDAEEEE